MHADTPLSKAHDLSQQLQDRLETLPRVERAFVHVDHETSHTPVRPSARLLKRNVIYRLCRSIESLYDAFFLYQCIIHFFPARRQCVATFLELLKRVIIGVLG
jgi:hypothetical protein